MNTTALIQPFAGLRPSQDQVALLSAPPYDVLNSEEARLLAKDNPYSFLHVSKAEIDLPKGVDPHDPTVYQTARENFQRFRQEGLLSQDPAPCYYVYRLMRAGRVQTGVVAAASLAAYLAGRIKKHEHTRPDKELDRTRLAQSLSAHSGPVFLVYRQQPAIQAALEQILQENPLPEYSFVAEDGVGHQLWCVADPGHIRTLTLLFEQLPAAYVADGHHRTAAAARIWLEHQEQHPDAPDPLYGRFMAVFFSDQEVRILDYNRVVRDLGSFTPAEFLVRLAERFTIIPAELPVAPAHRHEFGLFLQDQWYSLKVIPGSWLDESDPVGCLDVSILQDHVLGPLLGIEDPRRDERIDFIGGARGLAALVQRVRSGGMAVAFSLYPTSMAELLRVADAGLVMPPKSTWFEPKLRDGLVVQVL